MSMVKEISQDNMMTLQEYIEWIELTIDQLESYLRFVSKLRIFMISPIFSLNHVLNFYETILPEYKAEYRLCTLRYELIDPEIVSDPVGFYKFHIETLREFYRLFVPMHWITSFLWKIVTINEYQTFYV